MKNIRAIQAMLGATAALAALSSSPALAQDAGWYAGASVGRTGVSVDDARITSGLAGQGLGTSSIENRDRDTGYKLFGGYQFNRNFAVEGGYFDLGEFGYTARTAPAGSLTGDIRLKGLNVDLVGTQPLTERLSLLGRVGVTSARTEGAFSATGAAGVPYANSNPSQRSTNAKWGAGLAYAFTDSLSLRLEAERYRISDAVGNKGHADMVSAGLVYRFGSASTKPVMASMEPAPTPQAPQAVAAPAPALAPHAVAAMPAPVAAPVVTRVSLSADSLFDFDSSAVKAPGRVALDKLAADLRSVRYDAIRVTGHTDRLGNHAYNTALSTRRAAAVTDYLVQSGGVTRDKVAASGAGETTPVTATADCRGASASPALIACLQPDRRVDVEVQGTR